MASTSAPLGAKKKIYDSPVELDLVHRAKKGDESAFRSLYDIHHNRVFVTINRMVVNNDTSEWIANLVLAKVWDNLRGYSFRNGERVPVPGFKEQSKFSTWVTRIAINEARMHLRSERRRHREISLDAVLSADSGCVKDPDTSNSRWLAHRDLELAGVADRQVLDRAITKVPTQFREILRMRFWEGMSLGEIQAKISAAEPEPVSIPAVKSRILRGRTILIEQVERIS